MSSKASELPPAVSNRNHFTPIQEIIDGILARLPSDLRNAITSDLLWRFAEEILLAVQRACSVGATNGIDQAINIVRNPSYYERVKQRRSTAMQREVERREGVRQEYMERDQCPTAEQLAERRKYLTDWIAYHERVLAKSRAELAKLPDRPKLVRLPPRPAIRGPQPDPRLPRPL